jgi:hypothetical protein
VSEEEIANIQARAAQGVTERQVLALIAEIRRLQQLSKGSHQANRLLWSAAVQARGELDSVGARHAVEAIDEALLTADRALINGGEEP